MHALRALLDALFPPREEARLVREATLPELRVRAQPRTAHGAPFLLPFSDSLVRALVHEAKFKRNQRAIELLGAVLAEHCATPVYVASFLIPVPLSRERLRERGYNQVALIARAAKLPVVENLLIRPSHTPPQTSLTRRERLANVHGAFALLSHELPTSTPLLVLDDVTTTGATLREAVQTLRDGGFTNVKALALAH